MDKMFEKRKLFVLFRPFKGLLRRNTFKQSVFNKKYFNFFGGKFNNFPVNYSLFSIFTASILILSGLYQNSKLKQVHIKKISYGEIENVILSNKNTIILSTPKGTAIKKNPFIKELVEYLSNKDIINLDISIYYTEDTGMQYDNILMIALYKEFGRIEDHFEFEIGSNKTIKKIKDFFIHEQKKSSGNLNIVKNISLSTFESSVINGSSELNPLLLMHYDHHCLMCFLIRPFINSIAFKLKNSTNIQFARYNIEENDLHKFSPAISATPTFVLYRGKQEPEVWDEYKPIDIVKKVIKILSKTTNENRIWEERINFEDFEQKIFFRFQLFTLVNLWELYLLELQNLLKKHSKGQVSNLSPYLENLLLFSFKFLNNEMCFSKNSSPSIEVDFNSLFNYEKISEKSHFQEIMLKNISKDMKRSDTIEENISYLLDEINEYCIDYLNIRNLIE